MDEEAQVGDEVPPRPPTPTVVCRLCRQGIWTVQELVLVGVGAAHAACVERSATDDLTDVERSRLIRHCWNHAVARCEACAREYRLVEMGTDLLSGRYYFCPFCRTDLVWSVRQHIVDCPVVSQNDPRWQAEVRETLAHARETRKISQRLRDATELTRVESDVNISKARQAAERAREAQQESERITGEPPNGVEGSVAPSGQDAPTTR